MYVYGYGLGLSLSSIPQLPASLPAQPLPAGSMVTTTGNITGTVPGTVLPTSLVKTGTQLSLVKPAVSPAVAAAILAAGAKAAPTPAIVPFAPAKSAPVPGTTSVVSEAAFAEACKRDLNGTVVAPGICRAPDGAEITVDGKTGQPMCRNQVGMCSPAAQAAAAAATVPAPATSNAMLVGAAALAALLFLR